MLLAETPCPPDDLRPGANRLGIKGLDRYSARQRVVLIW